GISGFIFFFLSSRYDLGMRRRDKPRIPPLSKGGEEMNWCLRYTYDLREGRETRANSTKKKPGILNAGFRSIPKVITSSALVSSSTIINVPQELYSIDVAATFGVPLTTVDHMETLEALGSICNSIKVDRNNADVIPCKVSYADDSINLNVDESTIPSDPIVQSVDINKSTSYAGVAGGSAKYQPNVNSNFHTLVADPVFDGVNISIPRKVVEKIAKEELTRISIWVKLHDVPIQVFEEDDISLIAGSLVSRLWLHLILAVENLAHV
ncbi:hypothetical protein Tco_1088164, partial [Tanacetum coccineum]